MTTQFGKVVIQIIAVLLLATFQPILWPGASNAAGTELFRCIRPEPKLRHGLESHRARASPAMEMRMKSVVIDYAKGPCKGPPHGWNVPAGTVLQINLYPKSKSPIAQLGLNEKEYDLSQGVGETAVYYTNVREGIKYAVNDGVVHSISYIPSRREINLRCKGFPAYEGGVREYRPYAAFSAKAQMIDQRLGEFGLQLADNERLKGFIITYAGQVAKPGEAKLMGETAKLGLIQTLGLPAGRIILIDGGFRETAEYELFLLSPEKPSPAPTPTLSSNQVKILGQRGRRLRPKTK